MAAVIQHDLAALANISAVRGGPAAPRHLAKRQPARESCHRSNSERAQCRATFAVDRPTFQHLPRRESGQHGKFACDCLNALLGRALAGTGVKPAMPLQQL
jgi:hypothetical protein